MTNTLINWLQKFFVDVGSAFAWLTSTPFKDIQGVPSTIQNLTPLALVGLSGLIAFIVVAIVKWVIS